MEAEDTRIGVNSSFSALEQSSAKLKRENMTPDKFDDILKIESNGGQLTTNETVKSKLKENETPHLFLT